MHQLTHLSLESLGKTTRFLTALKHAMRISLAVACLVGCSRSNHPVRPYGAQGARLGEALGLLGWNMSVSNLRWDDDYVLVDVDAAPTDPKAPHAKPVFRGAWDIAANRWCCRSMRRC